MVAMSGEVWRDSSVLYSPTTSLTSSGVAAFSMCSIRWSWMSRSVWRACSSRFWRIAAVSSSPTFITSSRIVRIA